MTTFELSVSGMHCDACARRVRKALEATAGVRVLDVTVGTAKVEAEAADGARAAIERAGYHVEAVA